MMYEEFAASLGVTFRNIQYLERALTHRSYLNENRTYDGGHNERLEFLGDAVLELVVTEYLYHHYDNPEGELTAWRAALVNTDMLARVATDMNVASVLRMGRGEAKGDNRRARHHILANTVEAIIGALYLDQGYDAAKAFITQYVLVYLDEVLRKKLYRDPKSYFQEQAQRHRGITPHYDILREEGPDHARQFVAGAFIGEEMIAQGTGQSKQEAQRAAALAALEKMGWQ